MVAKVNLDGIQFKKAADRNNDVLTIVSVVFDRNGNFVKGIQRVLDMKLRKAFPNATIELTQMRDSVVVTGQARDAREVQRVLDDVGLVTQGEIGRASCRERV